MYVHHTAGAVGGNNDETIMLPRLMFADRILANRGTKDGRPVTVTVGYQKR